jgi:HEAT repeat protein
MERHDPSTPGEPSLRQWLGGGDLRSDGHANEVASFVEGHPEALEDLLAGLSDSSDVIRGRVADALEKVGRHHPDWVVPYLDSLIKTAGADPLPMVRWHLAMLLGHLAVYRDQVQAITGILQELLRDPSAFVRSWAVTSLCTIGRLYPERANGLLGDVAALHGDPSAAVRHRANRALRLLLDPSLPVPAGGIKSSRVNARLSELVARETGNN